MGHGATVSRRLTATDPFVVHLQFRLPPWRAQRGHRRLESALRRTRVPDTTLTITLTDDVVATISVPGGTIRQALRGEPPATAALRAAQRLAEALRDLDPVLVDAPEPGTVINSTTLDVGAHRVLRVVRQGHTVAALAGVSA